MSVEGGTLGGERFMYKVRYDIFICLFVASILGLVVVPVVLPGIYAMMYDRYVEAHTVADGEIGGLAGEDVVRARSVDDLLSNETFTVELKDSAYAVAEAADFGKVYLDNIELPSGERVAFNINRKALDRDSERYTVTLPVGKVVYADLSKDEKFMERIEKKGKLPRTDFYVDMLGTGSTDFIDEDTYDEKYTENIKFITIIVSFCVLHMIGSKIGFFPRFFRRKVKKEE